MMKRIGDRNLAPSYGTGMLLSVELGLAHAFLVLLPNLEAPKNVALGLYLLMRGLRAANVGRHTGFLTGLSWRGVDRFDLAMLALLCSGVATTVFANPSVDAVAGLRDLLRIAVLAWCVKRANYSLRQRHKLLWSAIVGTLIALPFGLYRYGSGQATYLELPSVGHVNQSAMYLALATIIALALAVEAWRNSGHRPVLISLVCVALTIFTFVSQSRGAIVGLLAAVLVLGWTYLPASTGWRKRLNLLAAAAVVLALAIGTSLSVRWFLPAAPTWLGKVESNVESGSDSIRLEFWRIGLQAWSEQPWFGIGIDAFPTIDTEHACRQLAIAGYPCRTRLLRKLSHPHNLYVEVLVERGLIGAIAFGLLFWAWSTGWRVDRREVGIALSAASLGALVIVLVCGLVNTTMRVEHGNLALLLWALAASRGASDADSRALSARSGNG